MCVDTCFKCCKIYTVCGLNRQQNQRFELKRKQTNTGVYMELK